jgi:hypothetical protein
MTVESSAKSTSSNSPTEVGEVSTLKLKFIFANNDGVHVEMECSPSHSVESVSKALIEHWPNSKCAMMILVLSVEPYLTSLFEQIF